MNQKTKAERAVPNFVGGTRTESASGRFLPVTDPSTGETIARVPLSTKEELDAAVNVIAAVDAGVLQSLWQHRCRVADHKLFSVVYLLDQEIRAQVVQRERQVGLVEQGISPVNPYRHRQPARQYLQ